MTFTDPYYLLLLIPAIAWMMWVGRRIPGLPRDRRIVVLALRFVVLLLLVLALAGLQAVRKNRGISVVFLLDKSASINGASSREAQEFVEKALQGLGPNDRAGLIAFGKNPIIDSDPGELRTLGRVYASPDPSSTDIAAAIRLGAASVPVGSGARLVLLSDGDETTGDAVQAAQACAASGVQIDAANVSAVANDRGEVLIKNVDTPSDVTRGQPFELRVVVEATRATQATIHVDRDGAPVATESMELAAGINVVPISQSASSPGFYRYRATIEAADDTDPRNNTGIGFVNVRGRPRVLIIEAVHGSAQALATALTPHDIDITRAGIDGLPTSASELAAYDSMILSDFPASGLTPEQMTMIAAAVSNNGMGFGMIGGDNSFLPGGYFETPIADLLPVDLNVRQRKTFPSTCIEIIVDASGSMTMPEDGVEKIKIAGTAAAAMVRMMSPNDLVGVAGSTDAIQFVAPIQRAVNKDQIAAECGTLDAGGGGIYVEPSLEFAYKSLLPVNTKVKHLILLADGDDCETQEGSYAMAQKMVSQGMTISVIAVGDGKDVGFCRTLAAIGKGYYYLANQAKELQRLVTQDSSLMARSAIETGAFLPKADPTDEVLRGLDLRSTPPLYAYDLTSRRPMARTPMLTNKDDPLLAYWQYGLGTSMAFTSDAEPKWARAWMGWPEFNAFWAQAIRGTLRQTSTDHIQMSMHRADGKGVIDLSAFDSNGSAINNLQANVTVTDPAGGSHPLDIEQTGPGRYSAAFDADTSGGYLVTAAQLGTGGSKPLVTEAGFAVAYPPEYEAVGPNTSLLRDIAKTSGGVMLSVPVEAFRPIKSPGQSVRDLWPDLLLTAALLFILDIAARRIALPYGEIWDRVRLLALGHTSSAVAPSKQWSHAERSSGDLPGSGSQDVARIAGDTGKRPAAPGTGGQTATRGHSPQAVEKKDAPRSAALNTTQRLLDLKRKKPEDK